MLRDRRTTHSRHSLVWIALIVGAVAMLLAVGGCGGVDEDVDAPDSNASEDLTPTPPKALTSFDLPDLVLQRSDIPLELELVAIEQDSELEYKTEYELPDPAAGLTGLRSVSSVVRLGNASFPSLDDVRSLQRHTLDAVEIPNTSTFGDESILYRVTVLADHSEHHIYYGFINLGEVAASLIGVQGTLPEPSPAEVEATVADILLLMQSQENLLLQ